MCYRELYLVTGFDQFNRTVEGYYTVCDETDALDAYAEDHPEAEVFDWEKIRDEDVE